MLELGAEFNQGRYIDPDHPAHDENIRNGYMLCEIVFQYYSPLLADNHMATNGNNPANPVNLYMAEATSRHGAKVGGRQAGSDDLECLQR